MDVEKIAAEYEKIKLRGNTKLLPLQKIFDLENAKTDLINNFLIKIDKIDLKFEIVTKDNFNLEDVIKFAKLKFGEVNFLDNNEENGKLTIDIAFHFCILSLNYESEKMKYKVTLFWDV